MHTADAVIIGGGIVGSSIAYHLTAAGCRGVIVVERETQQGLGSTGKSMGGVRAQFASELNIRMSMYSIPMFRDFEQITGHPSGYRDHGYLFMGTSDAHLEYLRTNVALQQSLGVDSRIVTVREIADQVSIVRTDDIAGGSFCPSDGFVDPYSVMHGFMKSAERNGATLMRGTEVTDIERDAHGVVGVCTTAGDIATRVAVNAAGPWAAQVARMAGLGLRVQPAVRTLVPSEPFPGIPDRLPMTIDMSNGFHFRPEGAGILMAWNDPDESAGDEFVEKILGCAVNRVPAFENLQVNPKRAWSGFYEMTPDHQPVLGPAPELEGFYYANGFSGHGVMHSPAAGRLLAEWILEGTPKLLDAGPFRADRFDRGELFHEPVVL